MGVDDSADEFRLGVGTALGSTRVIEIDSDGATVFQKSVTFAGSTPTVTIGDAGAEDAKIVFDGNAQDYHIGLDDSADSLILGLGSALGTTEMITLSTSAVVLNEDSQDLDFRVESNNNDNALFVNAGSDLIDFGVSGEGHLRPSFYASKDGTAQTIANDTNTKVTFNTELIDSDSKFSDSRFTPTIAGYYFINSTVSMTNHPQNAYTQIRIKKNGSDVFQELHYNQSNSGEADNKAEASFIIYLDGDDYLEIFIRQNSGGNENTRTGHECRFMGYRIH